MRWSKSIRRLRNKTDGWSLVSVAGAAVILLPILYVLSSLLHSPNENWVKVKQYLLADYVIGSLKLVLATGFFATLIGVVLAWLVMGYNFPLRRFFRWALLLPLAIPPYIAAYTYGTMTSYTGIVQATLRNQFNITLTPGTIEVMSFRGAVFIMTLFLYPYVYMIACSFLERQSASYIENARLLGSRGLTLFFRIVLPITRPAIIAGVMLVIFEVLSDYGVANFFGVQTISTAIFQTWFGMYDVQSATRLAAWLMLAVVGIFIFERYLRRNRQFYATSRSKPLAPSRLKGIAACGAVVFCSLIWILAFLSPVVQIIMWSIHSFNKVWRADFIQLMLNSVMGATLATFIILIIALLSARTARLLSSGPAYVLARIMTAGYAVPGAIIAIGVLAVFISLDEYLMPIYVLAGLDKGRLVLSLSLVMLITGYIIRFMATGYNAIEAGYEKIPRTYSEAASTLGISKIRTFVKVDLSLLKSSLFSAFIVTFVEVLKELPLTLLLRPFNYNTLATRAYQYASDERIYEAALPSLLLIIVSLIPVLLIIRLERGKLE